MSLTTCPTCHQPYQSDLGHCPWCKRLIIDPNFAARALTLEDQTRIAEMVEKRLIGNRKFRRNILLEIALFGLALGCALYAIDIHEANKLLTERINAEFETPRIRQTVSEVAANQATNMMLQQITPQIANFRDVTSNTLAAYNKSLNDFEADSTNALEEVRRATQLSALIARANADDYAAYIELNRISNDSKTPADLKVTVTTVVSSITSYVGTYCSFMSASNMKYVSFDVDTDKATFDDIVKAYWDYGYDHFGQMALLNYVYHSERFKKSQRMEFAAHVLTESPSIINRQMANDLLTRDSHIHFTLVNIQPQIDWWNAHKNDYTNDIPKAH